MASEKKKKPPYLLIALLWAIGAFDALVVAADNEGIPTRRWYLLQSRPSGNPRGGDGGWFGAERLDAGGDRELA